MSHLLDWDILRLVLGYVKQVMNLSCAWWLNVNGKCGKRMMLCHTSQSASRVGGVTQKSEHEAICM